MCVYVWVGVCVCIKCVCGCVYKCVCVFATLSGQNYEYTLTLSGPTPLSGRPDNVLGHEAISRHFFGHVTKNRTILFPSL